MWYFTWILGIGVALAFGIINVMWLEAEAGFAERDESMPHNPEGEIEGDISNSRQRTGARPDQ